VGKQSRFDPSIGNVPRRDEASAGGWRRKGGKAGGVNQGDLLAKETRRWSPHNDRGTAEAAPAGVRASIRARKGRNGSGAKGRRKVET
jgi:hypothetical protein